MRNLSRLVPLDIRTAVFRCQEEWVTAAAGRSIAALVAALTATPSMMLQDTGRASVETGDRFTRADGSARAIPSRAMRVPRYASQPATTVR